MPVREAANKDVVAEAGEGGVAVTSPTLHAKASPLSVMLLLLAARTSVHP